MNQSGSSSLREGYIPIIEDVEAMRRMPPGVEREIALHLPQLTAEWHHHWYHYRRRVEGVVGDREGSSSSSSTPSITRYSNPSTRTIELPSPAKAAARLQIIHDQPEEQQNEVEEEEDEQAEVAAVLRYHRLFLRLLGISPSLPQLRSSAIGLGRKRCRDASTSITSRTSNDPLSTNNNNHKTSVTRVASAMEDGVCRLPSSASLQKEWCQSALSVAMLLRHPYSCPSFASLDTIIMTKPRKREETGENSNSSNNRDSRNGANGREARRMVSLAGNLLVERAQVYFHWRYFPELLSALENNNTTTSTLSSPQHKNPSRATVTLWEDRRHRLDDGTLQTSPTPILLGPSGASGPERTAMEKAEATTQRRVAAVLYPEDVRRMDPVAFRSRVEMLWDLAQAISFTVDEKATPPQQSLASFASHTYTYPLAKAITCSRDALAILLSHLSMPGPSPSPSMTTTTPASTASDIAGLLRFRLLLELCVLRLHAQTPRCPFLWRTLAQLLASLDTTDDHRHPDLSTSQQPSPSPSPSRPLPALMAQYIHQVILPYLHLKDRYIESIRCSGKVRDGEETAGHEKPELEGEVEKKNNNKENREEGTQRGAPPEKAPPKQVESPLTAVEGPPPQYRYEYAHQRVRALLQQYPNGLRHLLSSALVENDEDADSHVTTTTTTTTDDSLCLVHPSSPQWMAPISDCSTPTHLADHLMMCCGWYGDLEVERNSEEPGECNDEEETLVQSFAKKRVYASQGLLEHGIIFPTAAPLEDTPSATNDEEDVVNNAQRRSSSTTSLRAAAALFLLRNTEKTMDPGFSAPPRVGRVPAVSLEGNGVRVASLNRNKEEDDDEDEEEEGIPTTSTTTTTTEEQEACRTRMTTATLFHSTASRRRAWEMFVARYFLSDPRSAFDASAFTAASGRRKQSP